METAINIGQSCKLLTKEQNWFGLKSTSLDTIHAEILQMIEMQITAARKSAVIVDGFQLSLIQSSKAVIDDFVKLCTH